MQARYRVLGFIEGLGFVEGLGFIDGLGFRYVSRIQPELENYSPLNRSFALLRYEKLRSRNAFLENYRQRRLWR